jgi:hypothetical protein
MFCGAHLSVKNPHDSVANHILLSDEGATCKRQKPLEEEHQKTLQEAVGTCTRSMPCCSANATKPHLLQCSSRLNYPVVV